MAEIRKKLSEKQFTAITETQKAFTEARTTLGQAQQRVMEAEKAANLVLGVVIDAHGAELTQLASMDSDSQELVFNVPEAPDATTEQAEAK